MRNHSIILQPIKIQSELNTSIEDQSIFKRDSEAQILVGDVIKTDSNARKLRRPQKNQLRYSSETQLILSPSISPTKLSQQNILPSIQLPKSSRNNSTIINSSKYILNTEGSDNNNNQQYQNNIYNRIRENSILKQQQQQLQQKVGSLNEIQTHKSILIKWGEESQSDFFIQNQQKDQGESQKSQQINQSNEKTYSRKRKLKLFTDSVDLQQQLISNQLNQNNLNNKSENRSEINQNSKLNQNFSAVFQVHSPVKQSNKAQILEQLLKQNKNDQKQHHRYTQSINESQSKTNQIQINQYDNIQNVQNDYQQYQLQTEQSEEPNNNVQQQKNRLQNIIQQENQNSFRIQTHKRTINSSFDIKSLNSNKEINQNKTTTDVSSENCVPKLEYSGNNIRRSIRRNIIKQHFNNQLSNNTEDSRIVGANQDKKVQQQQHQQSESLQSSNNSQQDQKFMEKKNKYSFYLNFNNKKQNQKLKESVENDVEPSLTNCTQDSIEKSVLLDTPKKSCLKQNVNEDNKQNNKQRKSVFFKRYTKVVDLKSGSVSNVNLK